MNLYITEGFIRNFANGARFFPLLGSVKETVPSAKATREIKIN